MTQFRTNLSQFAHLMRDENPDAAWEFAHKLWQEHGIVVLVLPDVERKRGWSAAKQARNLVETCYGKIGSKLK